jgi:hypothetical protein
MVASQPRLEKQLGFGGGGLEECRNTGEGARGKRSSERTDGAEPTILMLSALFLETGGAEGPLCAWAWMRAYGCVAEL